MKPLTGYPLRAGLSMHHLPFLVREVTMSCLTAYSDDIHGKIKGNDWLKAKMILLSYIQILNTCPMFSVLVSKVDQSNTNPDFLPEFCVFIDSTDLRDRWMIRFQVDSAGLLDVSYKTIAEAI